MHTICARAQACACTTRNADASVSAWLDVHGYVNTWLHVQPACSLHVHVQPCACMATRARASVQVHALTVKSWQMMTGALKVLAESKCVLVGGHTCEGPDLSLGFAINGAVAYPHGVMRKGGLSGDHVLILTKALGTGVVLAAQMRGKAKGTWVSECIESMCVSNGPAVSVLRKFEVAACTDVTGFGLLGHLGEMLRGSSVGIDLSLGTLPGLLGAEECFAEGVISSLDKANRKHAVLSISNADDPNIVVGAVYSFTFPCFDDSSCLASRASYAVCANILRCACACFCMLKIVTS